MGAGVRGYVELHLPIRRAFVAAHHAVEGLASAEGLGHALRCWMNVVVGGMMVYAIVSRFPYTLHVASVLLSLEAYQPYPFFLLLLSFTFLLLVSFMFSAFSFIYISAFVELMEG